MAAGLSIAVQRHARLGAGLLGVMIFLFVILIHPRLIADRPGDAFAAQHVWRFSRTPDQLFQGSGLVRIGFPLFRSVVRGAADLG